jgi:hypothetical protein
MVPTYGWYSYAIVGEYQPWHHGITKFSHSNGGPGVHLKQQVVVGLVGLCHDDLGKELWGLSESLFGRSKFPSTFAIVWLFS